jgi:tetratricopeptide (TPR) repeat protein
MYMMHNAHFLCFTAMMLGRQEEAIRSARVMVETVPQDFLSNYTTVADGFMVLVPEVLMRFGRWQEILDEPEPRADLYLARALWRFTRASALTALGRTEQARAEQVAFEQAVAQVPKDRTMGNNSATNILTIAAEMLAGEMAAQAGDYDQAIQRLRNAVKVEDQLVYDEPPGWIQPTRHTLGAVLLKAGKATEAEVTYREELTRNPENGWSLMGLRDSLQRQGKKDEAEAINRRFKKAWAYADVTPPSTCYCQKLD